LPPKGPPFTPHYTTPDAHPVGPWTRSHVPHCRSRGGNQPPGIWRCTNVDTPRARMGTPNTGNRRQPFFLEQTTLAKVETYTAILTAQILPTVAKHTIEATTTLEPEGMDVATEGMRQKHTESRWQSRSGIQCTASVVRNRRQPATPFWKRPHSSAHTPCGLVPFPGRCENIIWGAARHQHYHTKHRRVGDTQHGHGPREHTP